MQLELKPTHCYEISSHLQCQQPECFKQLTDALTGHLEPKQLFIAERYYFYQ